MIAVIDENVPIVANEASLPKEKRIAQQADDACILASIEKLEKIVAKGVIVLDEGGEVISCYRKKLKAKGMPGTGDAFLKHLSLHQYDNSKVRLVHIEKHPTRGYEEFPAAPSLEGFDPSDRKFVALALSSEAVIVNAVDSDYSEHRVELKKIGVQVDEICPQCIKSAT